MIGSLPQVLFIAFEHVFIKLTKINLEHRSVIIFAIPSMYTITALPAERRVREMIPVSLYCHLVISALHSLKSSKLKLLTFTKTSSSCNCIPGAKRGYYGFIVVVRRDFLVATYSPHFFPDFFHIWQVASYGGGLATLSFLFGRLYV